MKNRFSRKAGRRARQQRRTMRVVPSTAPRIVADPKDQATFAKVQREQREGRVVHIPARP